jgi:hypothetical protein
LPKGLADENYEHILFAAWKRTEYLGLLQSASGKVTVVESKAMAKGFEAVPIPCWFVRLPGIFELGLKKAARREEEPAASRSADSGTAGGWRGTCIRKLGSDDVLILDVSSTPW